MYILGLKHVVINFNVASLLCTNNRFYSTRERMSAVKKDYSDLLPLLKYVLLCIYGNKYNLNKSPFKNAKMLILFLEGFENGIVIKDYKINTKYITLIKRELKDSGVNIQKLK